MAEEVRFELTEGVNPRRFSRPVHSTALPFLRISGAYNKGSAINRQAVKLTFYLTAQTYSNIRIISLQRALHQNKYGSLRYDALRQHCHGSNNVILAIAQLDKA